MFIEELTAMVGSDYIITSEEAKIDYSTDGSALPIFPFEVLAKPASAKEIAGIFQVCSKYNKPVTPRGGGSGVTGGALPVKGGVVLSLERLNKIVAVDIANGFAIVESGVITADFLRRIEGEDMFFPIAPGSKNVSFIGGNIAENSGSPGSCRYGSMGDLVVNLEVVLPTGEVMWTGANVYKNASGFNLTRLFAGSEGVLGIITKAVLKILPKPFFKRSILAQFSSLQDACNCVLKLGRLPSRPGCVELISEDAIRMTLPFVTGEYPFSAASVGTHLLIEVEGASQTVVEFELDQIVELFDKIGGVSFVLADTEEESVGLWKVRNAIHLAMTSNGSHYRDIDSCVPPACLYSYLKDIMLLTQRYDQKMVFFGHALDGNLHTMLLFSGDEKNRSDGPAVRSLLPEIFSIVISLGGSISGEHGIGCLQQEFLPLQYSQKHLQLMRQIKSVFDPQGILNPGKLFLDPTF